MAGNQTHGFSDTTLLGGIKIQGTKATVLPIPLILIALTMPILRINEAYSAAGEIGFSWWLVKHYSAYHIDCPDGCVSGEPARGRKDPPYFQMGYGSFDNIPDLVDTLVESLLPVQ